MDSRLHGVPLTATMAAFSKNTISGIRAPLTVDESDFEYSVLSKSRRNSMASSCYSNSELDEPEGFASCQDEEIHEKTDPFHEYEYHKPSMAKPNRETGQKDSFSNENGFSRPFVRNPGEKAVQESSRVDEKSVFRAFVANPDERSYRVISNVNDSDDSASFLSEADDEFVENENYDLNNSSSSPILAISGEESLVDGLTHCVDSKFSVDQKFHIPIAKLSRDSDDDSQVSEAFEEGFSGVVRIPSFDVLSRLNSAPKVRMSEDDYMDEYEWQAENMVEMEFVKDSLIITYASGAEDEKEHTDVEDIKDCVTSCEMVKDGGPDVNDEDTANSLAVNEDEHYNPIPESEEKSDLAHLEGEIQEIDVVDYGKKCSFEENDFPNQYVKSKKLETEREPEIECTVESFHSIGACKNQFTNQCVDVIKNVHEFLGSPEPLAENLQISLSDSHLGDDTSSTGSEDSQSVPEVTKLDQETEKEAEIALESLTFFSEMKGDIDTLSCEEIFLDPSEDIDCQISSDLDDGALVKPQSGDGMYNISSESASHDLGSMLVSSRPNIEAGNSNVLVLPPVYSELEGVFSEEERKKVERIQQIRVKYMKLIHGLGHSAEDSLASKVLRQLSIAEENYSFREFFSNFARNEAMELEAHEKDDLDFSLRILVIGKTGVGKSATVNSIIGLSKMMVSAFEPSTCRVMEINDEINGVKFKIFDTPGLRISPVDQSANRKILFSIKKIMRKSPPDVILYVDRLDTQFSYLNDLPLLKLVTMCLGPSMWQKAILVFTHADSLPPDGPDGCPLSYEKFVADQSRALQQLISQSAVEMNGDWIIPASLVENHPSSENNVNGETWRKRLLYLCCSMKVLSEVSSAVKIHRTLDRVKMLFEYGFLEPSRQILTRPVFELYDDCVYHNDVPIKDSIDNECCLPAVISALDPKSKYKFNIQLHSLVWNQESAQKRLDSHQTFGQIKKLSHSGKGRSDRKLSGKISVKTGYSDQLQIVGLVFFSIAKALFDKISRQHFQD